MAVRPRVPGGHGSGHPADGLDSAPWNDSPTAHDSRRGRAASSAWSCPPPTARRVVYLQGAHVAHFQPKGEKPVLWMSAAEPLRGRQADPGRGADLLPLVRAEGRRARRAAPRLRADPAVVDRARSRREADGSLRAVARPPGGRGRAGGLPARARALPRPSRVGRSLRLELTVAQHRRRRRARSRRPCTATSRCRTSGRSASAASRAWRFVDKTAAMARKPGESEPIAIARRDRPRLPRHDGRRSRSRTPAGGGASSSASRARPRRSSGTRGSRRRRRCPTSATTSGAGMVCVETANAMDDAVTLAPGATPRHDGDARGAGRAERLRRAPGPRARATRGPSRRRAPSSSPARGS